MGLLGIAKEAQTLRERAVVSPILFAVIVSVLLVTYVMTVETEPTNTA